MNIPYAYADLRFNPSFDKQTGYFTRSILCVPVTNKNGKVIGCTQVLNKKGVLNIGGKTQSVYDFAKKYNKKIKKNYLKKNSKHRLTKNSSINLQKLKKYLRY